MRQDDNRSIDDFSVLDQCSEVLEPSVMMFMAIQAIQCLHITMLHIEMYMVQVCTRDPKFWVEEDSRGQLKEIGNNGVQLAICYRVMPPSLCLAWIPRGIRDPHRGPIGHLW